MEKEYQDDFIARVKDLATIQLTPSQIAERLSLTGSGRRAFMMDIKNKKHPLYAAYTDSRENGSQDIMSTLHSIASDGNIDAIELSTRLTKEADVNELKKELFGI